MTELQVKSLLLLIGLAYCQGPSVTVQVVCILRGADFHSDICRATSNDSLLYFKANDTMNIYSDAEAAELGFNISLKIDGAGRMCRNLTANNMQYPMKLVCIESLQGAEEREERELQSYSIRIEDECDPPLITGADNGYDSLDMTNATTGPRSSGKDGIITATVVVTVLIVGLLVAAAIIYYCNRRSRPRRRPLLNNNDLDGRPLDPSNHGDGLPLDETNPPPLGCNNDNHEDNGDPSPVVPEGKIDSTMLVARRPSDRCPPRLDISRVVESGSEASSACGLTMNIKVQASNVENSDPSMEVPTAGGQCTDEGRMPPTYCYRDQICVNMNDSYEKSTYCVNPVRSQGCEEISPV